MKNPDLFIKERLPGGGYSDPVPAFGRGRTTEQKLQDAELEIQRLNDNMEQLLEFIMLSAGGAE